MKKPWRHLIESDRDREARRRKLNAGGSPEEIRKHAILSLKRTGKWEEPETVFWDVLKGLKKALAKLGFFVSSPPSEQSAPYMHTPRSSAPQPIYYKNITVFIRDRDKTKTAGYGNKIISLELHLLTGDGVLAGEPYLFHAQEALRGDWTSSHEIAAVNKIVRGLLPKPNRRLASRQTSTTIWNNGRLL